MIIKTENAQHKSPFHGQPDGKWVYLVSDNGKSATWERDPWRYNNFMRRQYYKMLENCTEQALERIVETSGGVNNLLYGAAIILLGEIRIARGMEYCDECEQWFNSSDDYDDHLTYIPASWGYYGGEPGEYVCNGSDNIDF